MSTNDLGVTVVTHHAINIDHPLIHLRKVSKFKFLFFNNFFNGNCYEYLKFVARQANQLFLLYWRCMQSKLRHTFSQLLFLQNAMRKYQQERKFNQRKSFFISLLIISLRCQLSFVSTSLCKLIFCFHECFSLVKKLFIKHSIA